MNPTKTDHAAILEARRIHEIDRNWPGKSISTGGEVHPDLIRFKDHWYCGFKETGRSRIIRSADGVNWETVKLMDWTGGFVGRPYFSITAENRLMVHTWIRPLQPRDALPVDRDDSPKRNQEAVAPVNVFTISTFSDDGLHWSEATALNAELLFSVTWHNSICYGIAPHRDQLVYSMDGKHWHILKDKVFPPHEAVLSFDPHDLSAQPGTKKVGCNETALWFDPDDNTAYALARTNPVGVILGQAAAPDYQEWAWRDLQIDWDGDGNLRAPQEVIGVQLGCPVLKQLSDGRLLAVGRADASDAHTNRCRIVLFLVDLERAVLTPFAKLDDYGGYSGVMEHDGMLWLACSNAQRPAFDVFLLKLKLP